MVHHYKVKRTKSGHIQYAPTIALQEKFQRKRNMKRTTRCFLTKKVLCFIYKCCTFSKDKRTMQKCAKKTHRATQLSATGYTFKDTLIYRYTDIRCRNNNLLTMPSNSVAKKDRKRCQLRKLKIERWLSFGHKLQGKSIVWFSPSRL